MQLKYTLNTNVSHIIFLLRLYYLWIYFINGFQRSDIHKTHLLLVFVWKQSVRESVQLVMNDSTIVIDCYKF